MTIAKWPTAAITVSGLNDTKKNMDAVGISFCIHE